MDTQIKELIAVGASVTANCQPCLTYHVVKAREAGTTEDEIRQAISIARMVRKGALSKMDEFASAVVEVPAETISASNGGCGCKAG